MQYHAIPCNTMQNHAIPCNTIQYDAIPCNTMQYNAIPCNTMQYHASLITADGAYHCPVGSVMAIFHIKVEPFRSFLGIQLNISLHKSWLLYMCCLLRRFQVQEFTETMTLVPCCVHPICGNVRTLLTVEI